MSTTAYFLRKEISTILVAKSTLSGAVLTAMFLLKRYFIVKHSDVMFCFAKMIKDRT